MVSTALLLSVLILRFNFEQIISVILSNWLKETQVQHQNGSNFPPTTPGLFAAFVLIRIH